MSWVRESDGEEFTLAWPDVSVEFLPETDEVVYSTVGRPAISLKDGDRIDVLGSSATGNRNYVLAPGSVCADEAWYVGDVVLQR